jgi:hypothetical protein
VTREEALAITGKEWCDKHHCVKIPEGDSAAIWYDFPDYCPQCRTDEEALRRKAEAFLVEEEARNRR